MRLQLRRNTAPPIRLYGLIAQQGILSQSPKRRSVNVRKLSTNTRYLQTGAARAKRVSHFGIPTVFQAWEKGYYKRGAPNERPPHQQLNGLLQLPDSAWKLRTKTQSRTSTIHNVKGRLRVNRRKRTLRC